MMKFLKSTKRILQLSIGLDILLISMTFFLYFSPIDIFSIGNISLLLLLYFSILLLANVVPGTIFSIILLKRAVTLEEEWRHKRRYVFFSLLYMARILFYWPYFLLALPYLLAMLLGHPVTI